MDWLLAPHNTVFAAAFVTLLCFALLEGVSLILGLGLSDWLSDLLHLPDSADGDLSGAGHGHGGGSGNGGGHGHGLQADGGGHGHAAPGGHGGAAGDGHGHAVAENGTGQGSAAGNDSGTHPGDGSHGGEGGIWGALLSWLGIGRVPVLVSLCVFLAAFSIGGMTLQQALLQAGRPALPEIQAGLAAFLAALPVLRFSNRFLGRLWPKDETSAFPADQLVGWVGVVTIGTASEDRAAEVRVTGPDRRQHYVMCRVTGESVGQGGEVLLLGRDPVTGFFRGRRNTNPDLSPRHFS